MSDILPSGQMPAKWWSWVRRMIEDTVQAAHMEASPNAKNRDFLVGLTEQN